MVSAAPFFSAFVLGGRVLVGLSDNWAFFLFLRIYPQNCAAVVYFSLFWVPPVCSAYSIVLVSVSVVFLYCFHSHVP